MAVGRAAGGLALQALAALTRQSGATAAAGAALAGCTAPARCLAGSSGPALGTAAAAWWRPSLLSPASCVLGGARGYAKYPPHTELQMPSLSPTMSQGNIASWKKGEGEEIAAGDVLAEVETDKATMDWEAQDEGYLAKILVGDGTKDIPVGTLVAIVVDEKDDVGAFSDYTAESGGGGEASEAAAGDAEADQVQKDQDSPPVSGGGGGGGGGDGGGGGGAGGGSYPPHTVLEMPALSPTMSQGNIATWKVKVGDEVNAGDSMAEVETDKATMDWESQEDGYIAAILADEGTKDIPVGTPMAVMVDDKDSVDAFKDYSTEDAGASGGGGAPASKESAPPPPPAKKEEKEGAPQPEASSKAQPSQPSGGRVIASPYARKLAREAGVDVADASGTGPGGRIVAADVQQLISSGGAPAKKAEAPKAETKGAPAAAASAPATSRTPGGYNDVPNSNIRKITAQRLLESKQKVPHYYVTVANRMDALMGLRAQINEALAASGEGKLSVNDFIVKAAALALRAKPEVNASWMGDFIRYYDDVDVSVAVQTPNGLMVPIVKHADELGLLEISAQVKSLAKKAKENKLKPDEFTGGTFTISNLGMYGVDHFAAIINPPQSCILAIGGTVKEPVVSKDGALEAASVMRVTLSADHRVVDGALGAEWLQAFKGYIENPLSMLV